MTKNIFIPAINTPFIVEIPRFSEKWEAEILEINTAAGDPDREYKILNKSTGTISEVEKKWFDTAETGRKITEGRLFVLTHNGQEVFRGSENACWMKLQRSQSQSADWATKYEGWKVQSLYK